MSERRRSVRPEPFELDWLDATVRGYRWFGDPNWIVLLHEPGEDLDAWADFPATLASAGYTVVAVDLPGHGLSDDPWDAASVPALLAALLTHIRSGSAKRCFVIAAGEVAGAALIAEDVDALVAVSPASTEESPKGASPPTLIIVGGRDRHATEVANRFFRQTRGWAVQSALGTARQGAAIFASDWGDHAREQVLSFLRDYRIADDR